MRFFFRFLAGLALSALLALLLLAAALLVFYASTPAWLLALSRAQRLAVLALSLFFLFLLVFLSPALRSAFSATQKKAPASESLPAKGVVGKERIAVRGASAFSSGPAGRYVCCVSGGFVGLMPSKGETESGAAGLDSIANRGGIFVIDSEAASAGGDTDVDSNFQNLVNSVLS